MTPRAYNAHRTADAIWQYLCEQGPAKAWQLSRQFLNGSKDAGGFALQLERAGYLVWLDEDNRLHPYRRIEG